MVYKKQNMLFLIWTFLCSHQTLFAADPVTVLWSRSYGPPFYYSRLTRGDQWTFWRKDHHLQGQEGLMDNALHYLSFKQRVWPKAVIRFVSVCLYVCINSCFGHFRHFGATKRFKRYKKRVIRQIVGYTFTLYSVWSLLFFFFSICHLFLVILNRTLQFWEMNKVCAKKQLGKLYINQQSSQLSYVLSNRFKFVLLSWTKLL